MRRWMKGGGSWEITAPEGNQEGFTENVAFPLDPDEKYDLGMQG